MTGMSRRFLYRIASAAVVLAGCCILFAHVSAQDSAPPAQQTQQAGQGGGGRGGARAIPGGYNPPGLNMHVLPPGGPAPRLSDGHVDFTGRYYPNSGGRMLDSATPGPVDPVAFRQFDPKVTPEEKLSFKPGMAAKYKSPVPYGQCDQAGTPSSITMQANQHGPIVLMQSPGMLRPKLFLATPISLSACAMMESVWILRSLRVVSGPATGDFPGCASAARALGVTCAFGVKEMRVRSSSFASPRMWHTNSPRHPYPAGLAAFGGGSPGLYDAFAAKQASIEGPGSRP